MRWQVVFINICFLWWSTLLSNQALVIFVLLYEQMSNMMSIFLNTSSLPLYVNPFLLTYLVIVKRNTTSAIIEEPAAMAVCIFLLIMELQKLTMTKLNSIKHCACHYNAWVDHGGWYTLSLITAANGTYCFSMHTLGNSYIGLICILMFVSWIIARNF